MFKLLILDVDGVLTDGKKTYDINGNVISKSFCDQDFTVMKKFMAVGVPVIWLSGDKRINEVIAKKRNIPFYYSKDENGKMIDKATFVPIFESTYNIDRKGMAYVGDDVFDLNIMKEVGYPFAPANACYEIYNWIQNQHNDGAMLSNNGGDNCLSSLWKWWTQRGQARPDISKIVDFDRRELDGKI